jgi:hypothetical protein
MYIFWVHSWQRLVQHAFIVEKNQIYGMMCIHEEGGTSISSTIDAACQRYQARIGVRTVVRIEIIVLVR